MMSSKTNEKTSGLGVFGGGGEVLNPKYQILTNLEVLQALNKDKGKGLKNLATITYETIQYLENSPCKDQKLENIQQFLKEIKKYNVTKSECLIMVNDPPTSELHIQLIIEDSEERLTESDVTEIIGLSKKYLLKPETDETIT